MSYNYGLSSYDLEKAKEKIEKQKDYLYSQKFLSGKNGEIKSLLDFSYSANLSTRYYARILNKVDTFVTVNEHRGYYPIFLTVTLDGFFRDFKKGKFKRWNKKYKEEYIRNKHIPNNDRMGYYLNHIEKQEEITDKDLYKILGWQLHRFIKSRELQNIRKKGDDYSMIRVTEPHKDGTPHMHILMYVSEHEIKNVYKSFKKYFPAPQNHKPINIKEDNRTGQEIFEGQNETKGFQTEIRSPAGYILKYLLKSFTNLINEDELDYLQAWYIKNKIPRVITTHTLLSQSIYHHASLLEDNWKYLTEIKFDGMLEQNKVLNTFKLTSRSNREIIYENGKYTLLNNGILIKEFGEDKGFKIKFTVECPIKYPKEPQTTGTMLSNKYWRLKVKSKYKYKIEIKEDYLDIEIDGILYLQVKETGELIKPREIIPVVKLSDMDLYDYYNEYDIENDNLSKYGLIKRELMNRGLLQGQDVPLQNYKGKNDSFEKKKKIKASPITSPITSKKPKLGVVKKHIETNVLFCIDSVPMIDCRYDKY